MVDELLYAISREREGLTPECRVLSPQHELVAVRDSDIHGLGISVEQDQDRSPWRTKTVSC
jgi:hypothetical protein